MEMLRNAYRSVVETADKATQQVGHFVLKLRDLQKNPEFLQKVCQVGFSTILAVRLHQGVQQVSKFTVTLMNVNDMQNFLGFTKLAYGLKFKVNVDTIDTNDLLYKLSSFIANQTPLRDAAAALVAKNVIQEQLSHMGQKDIAYQTVEEFNAQLQARVRKTHPTVDLAALAVRLHTPLLERLTTAVFCVTDLVCIPLYLQEWNIHLSKFAHKAMDKVSLGAQANAIGQTRVFQWMGRQDLGTIAWSLCCTGYALQLVEALRELRDDKLTANKKLRTEHALVSAVAEFVFSAASLLQVRQSWLLPITAITKSVSLLSIAFKPELKFLET